MTSYFTNGYRKRKMEKWFFATIFFILVVDFMSAKEIGKFNSIKPITRKINNDVKIKRFLAALSERVKQYVEDEYYDSREATPTIKPTPAAEVEDEVEDDVEYVDYVPPNADSNNITTHLKGKIDFSQPRKYPVDKPKETSVKDYKIWIGASIGCGLTLVLALLIAIIVVLVTRCRKYRQKRKIDIQNMSMDSFVGKPILDESNNFSINSDSDTTSSSEEELFNASGYTSPESSFSSAKGRIKINRILHECDEWTRKSFPEWGPKVTLTSTPIKENFTENSQMSRPVCHVRRHSNGSLPVSPLARKTLSRSLGSNR